VPLTILFDELRDGANKILNYFRMQVSYFASPIEGESSAS